MRCHGVTFSYPGGPKVLDRVDVDFPQGVSILLGPNGAGKSTLMALMASAIRAREGSINHGELTLGSNRQTLAKWRRVVGWVPQRIDPIPGMTAVEQVAYLGWLRGLSSDKATTNALRSLEQVGLADRVQARTTTLSGGQLRRVGIASALVHDCQVVVMDEPMAGLDPGQRSRLLKVVHGLPEVDWIISTHQTEDLAVLATHVTVLDRGMVVWSGPMEDFGALGSGAVGDDALSAAYSQLVEEEA